METKTQCKYKPQINPLTDVLLVWDEEVLDDGHSIYRFYEKSGTVFSLLFQDVRECRLLYTASCEFNVADYIQNYIEESILKNKGVKRIFFQNYFNGVGSNTDCPIIYWYDEYTEQMAEDIAWEAEGLYDAVEGENNYLDIIKWIGLTEESASLRSEDELMEMHKEILLTTIRIGLPFTKWDGEECEMVLSPREYWRGAESYF